MGKYRVLYGKHWRFKTLLVTYPLNGIFKKWLTKMLNLISTTSSKLLDYTCMTGSPVIDINDIEEISINISENQ